MKQSVGRWNQIWLRPVDIASGSEKKSPASLGARYQSRFLPPNRGLPEQRRQWPLWLLVAKFPVCGEALELNWCSLSRETLERAPFQESRFSFRKSFFFISLLALGDDGDLLVRREQPTVIAVSSELTDGADCQVAAPREAIFFVSSRGSAWQTQPIPADLGIRSERYWQKLVEAID